ncbi:MAG: pyridoxal phosphate-dependent aminotransferase [Planctomycetota bacterium]
MAQTSETRRHGLRLLPYMGVIAVVADAEKLGFWNGHPDWINLGQGQPEVGEMEGAPERWTDFTIKPEDHAYGPIHGTQELREKIAAHYNRLFRQGKASQYTAENVAVASGGRLALSRAVFALGKGKIAYQVPDYSAYEDMLEAHMHRCEPIPLMTKVEEGFSLSAKALDEAAVKFDLDAFLISNPCNPTGAVVSGEHLKAWTDVARRRDLTILHDEFYSHFIYGDDGGPGAEAVSVASFVEDVNADPILLFDGLTKCFRYPGWRLGWVLGPKEMIECFVTAGSSLDGGPSRVVQRAALGVLEADRADRETQAVRVNFAKKRNLMVDRLRKMGVTFANESRGTFYVFGCLDQLPEPFNDAETFYRRALEEKVMTVPGPFFDINPGKIRGDDRAGPFKSWMRFSFGPPYADVERGLDRLEKMLKN